MKKETLEEAAERLLSKEGVKLHYSGLETYLKGNVINAMVEMAKWQQEKSYSEEEVLDILNKLGWSVYVCYSGNTPISEWMLSAFEQFKKK